MNEIASNIVYHTFKSKITKCRLPYYPFMNNATDDPCFMFNIALYKRINYARSLMLIGSIVNRRIYPLSDLNSGKCIKNRAGNKVMTSRFKCNWWPLFVFNSFNRISY